MKERSSTDPRSGQGFTIVEILIVVIVIAILAAITIVAYNGITKRAVEASMQSDLETARNSVAIMKAGKKYYPPDVSAANDGQGLKASGNNELSYGSSGGSYFVAATNPATNKKFCLITGQIGECPAGAIVTTLAGNSTYTGVHDGTRSGASFGWPVSMAIDSSGDFYVGDCGYAVRRVTPGGVVTTVAGSNSVSGYVDGPAASARFNCIEGIAVDSSGVIYAADNNGSDIFYGIRKIALDGTVSTLAGSSRGYTEGTGTSAQFGSIFGIAIDASGNLYASDCYSSVAFCGIRKITPAGVVSTFAGASTRGDDNGIGSAAQFNYPHGITIDKDGNFFVADSANYRIRKITPAGEVTTLAGSGVKGSSDGTGAAAQFGYPTGITIDKNSNLYVTDNYPHSIRKITPEGVVTTVAGNGAYGYVDAVGSSVEFSWMENGIAIDASGALYITDSNNYVIRKIVQ